MVIKLFLKTVM